MAGSCARCARRAKTAGGTVSSPQPVLCAAKTVAPDAGLQEISIEHQLNSGVECVMLFKQTSGLRRRKMKNHLYESSDRKIHICEGSNIPTITGPYVVWTKCGIDVPANKSFQSDELPTCLKCKILKET